MKFFKVFLSNKTEVVLDEVDYDKLVAGMNSGSFVKLKKAIINPSFISHILPIKQDEALRNEKIEGGVKGYIDEETGVFKLKEDNRIIPTQLKDEFIG